MATISKKASQEALNKKYELLGERFIACMKHRLKQDGVAFGDHIVGLFGKWVVSRPKRITRYEQADFRLVDEFLDFAWPAVVDPTKSLPSEPPAPPPTVRRPRTPGIDWNAIIYQQVNGVPANQPVRVENIPMNNGDVQIVWHEGPEGVAILNR